MSTKIEGLLTADELAALARVNRMTVFRAAWRGEIPSVKIGYARRFAPDVLERLLETQSAQNTKQK